MIEAIVILVVIVGGCLFILKLGIDGWAVPALGYIAGVCLLIDFGLIQIVLGLPTAPVLTLGLVLAVPLLWWLSAHDTRRLSSAGAIKLAASLVAVMGLVYVFRKANLLGWTDDTLRYLMNGALIARDDFELATLNLLTKRLLAFPLIHAPANLAGEFYLRSAGPLLAISGLVLFVWLSLNGVSPGRSYGSAALTAMGVLWLVTSTRMVWSAFALFPHLLCAVLMLLIAGAGWLAAKAKDRPQEYAIDPAALLALQCIAVPALVVARAEGGLMAALAILPTVLCGNIALKYRALLLGVFGVSLAAWNFYVFSAVPLGQGVPGSVIGSLAFATLCLMVVASLYLPLMRKLLAMLEARSSLVLPIVVATLWIAFAGAAMVKPHLVLTSLSATERNLLHGLGAWGYSLVILAAMVVACTLASRGSELILLRFPVLGYIPLGFLSAVLRESPYRVGPGDSLDRMWIHIVPLAVLFVVAALGSDRWRTPAEFVMWRR